MIYSYLFIDRSFTGSCLQSLSIDIICRKPQLSGQDSHV